MSATNPVETKQKAELGIQAPVKTKAEIEQELKRLEFELKKLEEALGAYQKEQMALETNIQTLKKTQLDLHLKNNPDNNAKIEALDVEIKKLETLLQANEKPKKETQEKLASIQREVDKYRFYLTIEDMWENETFYQKNLRNLQGDRHSKF